VKASRQVAEGNLDAQVPVRSSDEIGELAPGVQLDGSRSQGPG